MIGLETYLTAATQSYRRRGVVSEKLESLKPLRKPMRTLTIDCMSSDESNDESVRMGRSSIREYRTVRQDWRAPWIQTMVDTFDHIHDLSRDATVSRDRRGAAVRLRQFSTKHTNTRRGPVTGLPYNFYNPVWLGKQNRLWVKNVLRPRPPMEVDLQPALE